MVGDVGGGAVAADSTTQEPGTVVVGPEAAVGGGVVGGLAGLGRSRVAASPGVVAARVMSMSVCWLDASTVSAPASEAWARATAAAAVCKVRSARTWEERLWAKVFRSWMATTWTSSRASAAADPVRPPGVLTVPLPEGCSLTGPAAGVL